MKNQYRPAWLAVGLLIPAMLVLLLFARDDDGVALERIQALQAAVVGDPASTTVPGTTPEPATASRSQGQDPAESADVGSDRDPEVTQASDEVAVLVEPATTTPVGTTRPRSNPATRRTARTSTPTTVATTTTPETTTTTAAPIEELIGICVFPNGTIASSVRQSACSGAFTLDPAEANRLAEELRGSTTTTTTTVAPTTSTTTTVAPTTSTTTTPAPITTTSVSVLPIATVDVSSSTTAAPDQ